RLEAGRASPAQSQRGAQGLRGAHDERGPRRGQEQGVARELNRHRLAQSSATCRTCLANRSAGTNPISLNASSSRPDRSKKTIVGGPKLPKRRSNALSCSLFLVTSTRRSANGLSACTTCASGNVYRSSSLQDPHQSAVKATMTGRPAALAAESAASSSARVVMGWKATRLPDSATVFLLLGIG